ECHDLILVYTAGLGATWPETPVVLDAVRLSSVTYFFTPLPSAKPPGRGRPVTRRRARRGPVTGPRGRRHGLPFVRTAAAAETLRGAIATGLRRAQHPSTRRANRSRASKREDDSRAARLRGDGDAIVAAFQ